MDGQIEEPMETNAESQENKENEPSPSQTDPPRSISHETSINTSQSSVNSAAKRPSPDEPRLMISKIVTENFKSYAGKISLGPFHKSFSCIIGPNGSGKSNVIDSMLFVFGYRAAKIRSKKLSVLIHKSEQHRNLTSCTVAVHFQKIIDTGPGDNDYNVVPNSTFVVSRTAYQDSSSNYYVDGKKVSFKEVTALLKLSGVDLDHNRFLILQGEVEQIAMMKSKAQTEHEEGMLEYLEDIIGSNQYKEPIEEMAKAVEQLNEERGEKLGRVKAVESEMEQLEKPMKEAQEFLKTENEITKKKHKLFSKYVQDCNVNEKKSEEKRNKVAEAFKEMKEELDKFAEDNKTKTKENKKIFKTYEKLSEIAEQKKADFAEFEQQDVKCREDLKHTKEKQKKLVKSLQKEKTKLEELQAVPAKSEQEIKELEAGKETLEKRLKTEEAKMGEIMASLKTETQDLQAEKDVKEEQLMGMQKAVNEAKSKKAEADFELETQVKKQGSAKAKLEKAKADLENTTTTLAERKGSIKELERQIPQLQSQLPKAQSDLATIKQAEAKASQELHALVTKVEEARSSLQSARDRGAVLEGLMEQARRGKITGIHGRLGDLGAIDEKYDVAISTACGALDNIVVNNIETAEKCVKFLRDNNVGVATFIAMDKMEERARNAQVKFNAPENVPRLYDLVRMKDPKFAGAFFYALGNTLVAKDLDQATRIGLQGSKRHRVVTLNGQLIEATGTMSGGGKQVAKGRMGCAVVVDITPEQFAAMERELEAKRTATAECRDRLRELEQGAHELEKQLNETKLTLKKHNMDIKAKAEQEVTLRDQIKELETVYKNSGKDVDMTALEKNAAKYTKEYNKVADAAAKVEGEVKVLHDRIMEIGSTKMKSQQAKLDKVTKEIDETSTGITKAKVAIKNAKRNIKRAEESVENMEKEEKENAETMQKIEVEFKRLEDDATRVLEAFREAEMQMKDMEGQLEKSKVELEKLQQQESEIKKRQVEVKHELEKYDSLVKENQQKGKHWKKELGKLELHALVGETSESLEELSEEQLAGIDTEEVQYEITVCEEQLAKMSPNLAAIQQYKKKEEAYLARVAEYDALTESRNAQRRSLEDMRKQRLDMFMRGFGSINEYLKEMYQMITLGGDAELELVDSLDPFSEGIVFSVRPPKKSWKNICNLSGGEKTLSSLSLVFALHQFKPNPLYVMDEIDAALDFKNVSIVGHYIKERTKNAQFIVISLRNNMFELADRLVGIYKTHNCSKTVSINPRKLAAQQPPLTEQQQQQQQQQPVTCS
ncbi:structural maintenance of chromosomes protein 4-like [Patiria miniata]|uniref:Structural maintenance of chromosomes protein n=1 Tax=Patiria miniata TaxID=46514 RepID=A0A913ZJT4_PATMI|nr:structural maintenance of chromosomes protein 4-like [Patiria miniata]